MADWNDFYFRTRDLPAAEKAAPFLERLPRNAAILDFGCGTGRWALAFLRDRPDLTVDLVDRAISASLRAHAALKGEKVETDFIDFRPRKNYDGIWAFHSLFFLPRGHVESVFHRLAGALTRPGIFEFSMVLDCAAARASRFSGMSETEIDRMLERHGLQPVSIRFDEKAEYGAPGGATIPTFYVRARKPHLG